LAIHISISLLQPLAGRTCSNGGGRLRVPALDDTGRTEMIMRVSGSDSYASLFLL